MGMFELRLTTRRIGPTVSNRDTHLPTNHRMKSLTFASLSLLACLIQVTALPSQDATTSTATTCGYSSCPPTRADKTNVHIVAHTHDDVGWLKTVDQYYYGTKKRYSNVGVQFILDSVIPQLVMDRSKRFIYVEMAFFTKWWHEQDDSMRDTVRSLVQEGRLEFINGGWCMNDEANVSYQSTIEQMTLGLRFLNQTFGTCGCPKVGWQIDPFGHTNEQASLFAQFGFDGMFFTREGWEDKRARVQNKSLDFMWHADKILEGSSGSIFTSIFRDGYDAPEGYCFDTLCLDDNLVDNKESYEYNIETKGESYIKFLRKYATSRAFNHILVPMGGDFQYSSASHNFKNLDRLIKYVKMNARDLNIFYSTPSCYQYALYQNISQGSNPKKLPEKFDDFLPYDSTFTIWWSGFFSSRPSGKLVERQVANLLPVTRQVSLHELLVAKDDQSWTKTSLEHESACLEPLWEILGDLQHHDAITGTEKQHVNDDYVRRSTAAMDKCAKFMGQIARKEILQSFNLTQNPQSISSQLKPVFLDKTSFCTLLNISQCAPIESNLDDESSYNLVTTSPVTTSNNRADQKEINQAPETRGVLLNIYNPLARHIQDYDIRLPCNGICDINRVQVTQVSSNSTLKLVRLPLPSGISTLPFRDATTTFEYLFYIDLMPLSRTTLLIEDQNNDEVVDGVLVSSREFADLNSPMSVKFYDEETIVSHAEKQSESRSRRSIPKRKFVEITVDAELDKHDGRKSRNVKDGLDNFSTGGRIIIKFDMQTGTLVGLRRAQDSTFMNITQKFGYYFPSTGKSPGAYIFRPNSTQATFIDKPESFKMFRKKDGSLIEIHQKWSNWIWQTIRVDAKKNYIEFDYVVGPVPILYSGDSAVVEGREVITRYKTSIKSDGIFMTDSNSRQLVPRRRINNTIAEDLGGSFYPVVSTMMLKDMHLDKSSLVDSVAILVDRPQAGTSLNEGELEFLIHRRHMKDDEWGVSEALNEPGEDGRGLVTRGKHRLYMKFADTPSYRTNLVELPETKESNLDYEKYFRVDRLSTTGNSELMPTYVAQDAVLDELRVESIKLSMKPVLTFDRLRVPETKSLDLMKSLTTNKFSDFSLLNNSLPSNIHLLTLQAMSENPRELLIRLENLDNPLTVHPFPHLQAYRSLVSAYKASSGGEISVSSRSCNDSLRQSVEVDIEYLVKEVRIVSIRELRLGANVELASNRRLDWPGLEHVSAEDECHKSSSGTSVKLAPRQIRTYLATFDYI